MLYYACKKEMLIANSVLFQKNARTGNKSEKLKRIKNSISENFFWEESDLSRDDKCSLRDFFLLLYLRDSQSN